MNRIMKRIKGGLNIKTRLAMYFTLLAIVPVFLIGLYSMKTITRILTDNAINGLSESARNKVEGLTKVIRDARKDIGIVKELSTLKNLLEAMRRGDTEEEAFWKGRLAEDFASLARNRNIYMQIRLLDREGREAVRVDYSDNSPRVVSEARLQYKGKKDYFTEAIKLRDGEIYYSALNLNREHGRIEIPYKPTIRLSTPVFDAYGKRRGVIVLNIAMGRVLEQFKQVSGGEMMLLDRNGYFLAHPIKEREWGSDLGRTEERFDKYYRYSISDILSKDRGIIKDSDVIFSYERVDFDPARDDNFWIAVRARSTGELLSQVTSFKRIFVLIVLGVAVVVIVSAMFIGARIGNPMIKGVKMAEAIAKGNLTHTIDNFDYHYRKDELGLLVKALVSMKDELNRIMGSIVGFSHQIASASNQLAVSFNEIARDTENQSSQIDQVATAMEEMSATVIEVSNNCQTAARSAMTTQELAVKGGEIVAKAVEWMLVVAETVKSSTAMVETLGKNSDQIGAIVAVINDIADQTNLLALNAAIEAARAGEHGRGFAVVADEVRKLAEKTTKSTKEIAEMIKTIQNDTQKAIASMHEGTKGIEEGVELATNAKKALQQIVSSVEEVTDLVRHISTATEEQSATTNNISANVTDIASIARKTAGGVKHISVASEELNSIAEELKKMVEAFILDERKEQKRLARIDRIERPEYTEGETVLEKKVSP